MSVHPQIVVYQQVLTEKLQPDSIAIIDESDQHAGHAGHNGGGASHLRLHIVGAAFEGLSRLARHRLVYDILNPWMPHEIHALVINAKTPSENEKI